MKKSVLVGYIFVAIICGITVGILVHIYNDNKLEKATLKEVEIAENYKNNVNKDTSRNIIQAGTAKEKSSPNASVIFETYHSKCGHIEVQKKKIEAEDVNKEEDYFLNKYIDWNLKSFNPDEINLYREIDGICDKHYIIKERDGYIAIYTVDNEDNETLKEITDVSVKYLPQEDIELLKKGIRANGDSELSQKIGDYE